ncbi:MAG TPA: hypothetical protein VGL22_10530 [Terracidiphilus sp.]|jgi:hypothetical protein
MAKQKSPHTNSQQNSSFAQTDLNPDDTPQTVLEGEDGRAYGNNDGAQTGGKRSMRDAPSAENSHKTEPQPVAYEGSVTSRTAHDGSRQGISNRSAESEAAGQEKVVSQREDAQAGLNHSGKASR